MTGELLVETAPANEFQTEIVELLYENLSEALCMVQMVRAEQESMPGRHRWDLVRMHKTFTTIRRLQAKIEDQAIWIEINNFADEVEKQWREL